MVLAVTRAQIQKAAVKRFMYRTLSQKIAFSGAFPNRRRCWTPSSATFMALLNPAIRFVGVLLEILLNQKQLTSTIPVEMQNPHNGRREKKRCRGIGRHLADVPPNLVQIDILRNVKRQHGRREANAPEAVQLLERLALVQQNPIVLEPVDGQPEQRIVVNVVLLDPFVFELHVDCHLARQTLRRPQHALNRLIKAREPI